MATTRAGASCRRARAAGAAVGLVAVPSGARRLGDPVVAGPRRDDGAPGRRCSSRWAGCATTASPPSASTSASTTRASGSCRGSRTRSSPSAGLDLFGHHVNLDPAAVRALLLAGRRAALPARGPGAGPGVGRGRRSTCWPATASATAWLARGHGRRAPAPPHRTSGSTWEFFHPDALAIAPLLFAYWAATRRALGLVRGRRRAWPLACKEDVALAVVVLGLLDRRAR